ncbi:conserved exported hypothetical protein [Pseudomonas sp. 8AS]|uniref:DUF1302 domain-containing protein n=1 Tax=Pseudomonas sp. 8AS TaxID=2653163 RepID=UPI0012F293CA|nr:DUF1302 family protein [Pseudomonas sp. 8AS]VXC10785.1 conserved exported hypothetical protein [Pseudomonas sp. 8AS]
MNYKYKKRGVSCLPHHFKLSLLGCAVSVLAMPGAQAGSFEFGDGIEVDYLTTFNYGLNMRAEKQSHELLSNINGDDGNRNFDRGSFFNNRASLLAEMDIHKGDYGLMLRGSSFYDFAYNRKNDNHSPDSINKLGDVNEFSSEAEDRVGSRTRLLDAYAYGGTTIGDSGFLDMRLGNQVVAWGESLFISGISGVQGPVDATKANIPGTEIKEILLPELQASGRFSFSDWTLLGYYQFKNHPYELSPAGEYFSYADMIGPGGQYLRISEGPLAPGAPVWIPGAAFTRTETDNARDGGEWGVGARYKLTAYTEVGAYRLRYHERTPSLLANFDPATFTGTYSLKYFEDVDLTGASLSTRIGDWQVSGEVSYKDGLSLYTKTGVSRGEATQAQVSLLKTWGDSWIAPQASFAGEFGALHINDVDDGGVDALANDRNAQFGQFLVTLTYPNVFNGWDLDVPFSYGHAFNQSSVGTFGFGGDGDARASLGAKFKYLNNFEVGTTYNAYLGSADQLERPLADRDFVSINFKYNL